MSIEEDTKFRELVEYLCNTTSNLHGKQERIISNYLKMSSDEKNRFVLELASWGEQTEALLCGAHSALSRIKIE